MKIIVDMAGGLGNQLFSYCFGYALAREKKAQLYIDTSMQDCGIARELGLLNFNVGFDKRISYKYKRDLLNRALYNKIRKRFTIGFNTKIYNETNPTVYDSKVFNISKDTYFKGNWQSEKYFTKYRDELLKILTPVNERSESVRELIGILQESNSVALHIRRGDYVKIGCQLNMIYYDKALQLLKDRVGIKSPKIYVFSDDIDYCKEYFNKYSKDFEFNYPEYDSDNTTLDDLLIMSNCKHIIMANSSFSWWAAWLNTNLNKIVICPELGMWCGDFYPEEWIKIKL